MDKDRISELAKRLELFAGERDWDQFHTPKNLAMALGSEVGELQEIFQWMTAEQSCDVSGKELAKFKEEIADVFIYTVMLCNKLGVDLLEVSFDKVEINERKYPAQMVKGSSKKYTEYDS